MVEGRRTPTAFITLPVGNACSLTRQAPRAPASPRHASVQYMARNRLDRATPRETLYHMSPAVAGLRSLPRCTRSAGSTYTGRYLHSHRDPVTIRAVTTLTPNVYHQSWPRYVTASLEMREADAYHTLPRHYVEPLAAAKRRSLHLIRRMRREKRDAHRERAQVGLRQELYSVGVVADARMQEVAGHAADKVLARRPLEST